MGRPPLTAMAMDRTDGVVWIALLLLVLLTAPLWPKCIVAAKQWLRDIWDALWS